MYLSPMSSKGSTVISNIHLHFPAKPARHAALSNPLPRVPQGTASCTRFLFTPSWALSASSARPFRCLLEVFQRLPNYVHTSYGFVLWFCVLSVEVLCVCIFLIAMVSGGDVCPMATGKAI